MLRAICALVCALSLSISAPSSATPVPPSASPVNPWSAATAASARSIFVWTAHAHPQRPRAQLPARYPHTPRVLSHQVFGGTGSVNGYPCGGHLPPCYVLARESGGNPTARNPRSTASGLWQFLDSTWAHFDGYARAYLAPPSVQNAKAILVWADGRGCSHWSAC